MPAKSAPTCTAAIPARRRRHDAIRRWRATRRGDRVVSPACRDREPVRRNRATRRRRFWSNRSAGRLACSSLAGSSSRACSWSTARRCGLQCRLLGWATLTACAAVAVDWFGAGLPQASAAGAGRLCRSIPAIRSGRRPRPARGQAGIRLRPCSSACSRGRLARARLRTADLEVPARPVEGGRVGQRPRGRWQRESADRTGQRRKGRRPRGRRAGEGRQRCGQGLRPRRCPHRRPAAEASGDTALPFAEGHEDIPIHVHTEHVPTPVALFRAAPLPDDQPSNIDYELPPLTLLNDPEPFPVEDHEQKLREVAALLEKTFSISASMSRSSASTPDR